MVDNAGNSCQRPTMFRVWSADRQQKKLVSASSVQELVRKGREKLNISTEDCQLVLEDDGTEVDEDVDVVELAGRTFILLAKGQCWSETLPVGATPASVPEPEPTKPPASEHSLSPEGTTRTPVDFPGQLMRSSLGQSANIGDLYDATTDRFTGQSVVTRTTQHLAVKTTPMESPAEECILDDILYDGLVSLVNEKELKLSVAVGMVEDINMSPMHGVFLRTLATLREEVKSITDIKRLVSSHDTTVSERATHVVVGVVWGATVAACLDRNDSDVQSKSSMDGSSPDLQTLMSVLKYGALPNSQVLSDINNVYTIRCFSNCLPQDTQQCRTSLEDALAMLSNLPRLIHSANNGKGARLSFILMPLSLLTDRTPSVPVRIEDSLLTKTLALFREVTETKHKFYAFAGLSQYLDGHKNYLQKQELGKIDEFLAGFQHAQKKLYDDVARAVVAVRSGRLDQSRLDDILHAFSHGLYSVDSVTAFCNRLEPTLQRLEFFDELIHEGIVIIGNSRTDLRAITRDPDVYILYATEGAKRQHPRLWEENSSAFLDIARQEKRKREKRRGNRSASTFAYIDCDIVHAANVGTEIAIYHYKHDQVVSRDVAAERAVIASLNIAESSQEKQQFRSRPAKLAVVEMACPGASSKCDSSQRVWSCEVCKEDIEYGFDDYFYCSCGRAPVNTFSYKCSGSYHGDDYLAFPPRVVEEHVRNMKPIRELNILFLGETGVGKSTWINGFANYISYSTLSEAENSKSVCLIPTKFTMTNENCEEVEIKTGTDKNENQQAGQSSTQMPQTYVFRRNNIVIRIIDTPGIGDTRGIDHDKINFEHIMAHLSHFDEIHGICVLLKPNNARLTVMFRFCIKELLTHLHRDACKNIVFCFTNARSTFYKPGDTLPALRQLITFTSSPDIDLRLCRETIYCIDNESVRFLAALKQGIKFEEEEKKNYSTSWEMSVKETERLIKHISSLPPHKVKNTLSLNDARRRILELSRPLVEITSNIQNNIGVVEQRRREITESTKAKEAEQVPIKVVDNSVEKQIKDKAYEIEIIKQHLQSLEDRIKKLDYEKLQVIKVIAKFACFLKHNAIAAYNDATLDYLQHLIEVEKGTVSAGGSRSKLVWLTEMKSVYEEEVKVLEQAISNRMESVHLPTTEEIKKLCDDLCCLEITGPMLKNTMKVAEAGNVGAMQHNEKRIKPFFDTGNSAKMSQPQRISADIIKHGVGRVVNKFWQ